MLTWIVGIVLSKLFGDGFAADLAGRGTAFLAAGAGKAIRRDDERVTRVRLSQGETYTVIARPAPSRRERKLASEQSSLLRSYRSLTRPSRSQVRVAKKLARTQRRLARTNEGSKRFLRRTAAEERLGLEFDRKMRPSKKELKVAERLDKVSNELDSLRATQMAKTTSKRKRRRRRVTIYS
ncbi:MAG: hypothetical protein WBF71_16995 [Microthrixaceae bacterium]